jgi:SMP-30/gluconolaconase/LRE-like protein
MPAPTPPDATPSQPPPPPPDAAPAGPPECENPALRLPVVFNVMRATPGGDLTFDSEGFMVAPDGRDITRTARSGMSQMLINNAVQGFGVIEGIELMPDGAVVVTNRQAGSLVVLDRMNGGGRRRAIDLAEPVKVLRAPGGRLYVAGALGDLFLVEPDTGKVTSIARTNGHLRGLSYSLDFKTLYISDSGNRALLTAKVRPDGTVDPPVMFAKGLGSFADGVATDICGNVFISDNNGGPLLRVNAAAKVEMVSPLNGDSVAGLAFGSGKQGWDDHSLYAVSDRDNAIYEIKLGVRGAPPLPNEP